ncbi:TPA: hypothetical protein ACXHSG_005437, partial [Klebsiella pneumoniae]
IHLHLKLHWQTTLFIYMRIERIGGMGGICGICCKALMYKGLFVPPAFHLHFLPWNLAFQGGTYGGFSPL